MWPRLCPQRYGAGDLSQGFPPISQPLLIVVGLTREAKIAAPRGRVAIGAAGLARAMAEAPPAGIVSFGLCGALDPGLKVGDVIVADAVVHGDQRWAADAAWGERLRSVLPSARRGAMAAGAAIIATPEAKAALRRDTGATSVDMESHAVAAAAWAAGIPFAVVRVVSDDAARALPRSAQAGFKADGDPDVGAVIVALARRPWELPALIQVGRDAETAFRALTIAANALIPPP